MEEVIKSILSGAGVAGAVLIWHLLVVDKRLRAIEAAIDTSTRADIIRLIASPHVSTEIKEKASEMIKELDVREEERKKKI